MPFRSVIVAVIAAVSLFTLGLGGARADKPARIPVAFGQWTGPHAGTFKSGLRGGLAKECVVVKAEKARVIIDGEVSGDKTFKVRVVVKSPQTKDTLESKEYSFSKPSVSEAQSHRMGRDVAEIARRAPDPGAGAPAP
jgi:hypothetical protein